MGRLSIIGGTKGGSGKSTTTCQLAVMRAHAGKSVCIYDLDKQRSSHRFVQARSGAEIQPALRSISGFMNLTPGEDPIPLGRALIKDLRDTATQYDDVLIDCGGEDNPALRFAMLVADAMVVPLAPAQFDIWALSDLNKVYNDTSSSRTDDFVPVVFPCLVSPQTSERDAYDQVRDAYKAFAWAPAGAMICHRSAYRRTIGEGKGIFDLPRPDPKAKSELLQLYKMTFGEDWMRNHD
jgi:chromosome partitioning protein